LTQFSKKAKRKLKMYRNFVFCRCYFSVINFAIELLLRSEAK